VRASGDREPSRGIIALTLAALLSATLVTEAIGVHAIFGAFLFGAVLPHDSRLARTLTQSLDHLVASCCCPRSSPSRACARRSGCSRVRMHGSPAASSSQWPQQAR
jgi:hypothetical protein